MLASHFMPGPKYCEMGGFVIHFILGGPIKLLFKIHLITLHNNWVTMWINTTTTEAANFVNTKCMSVQILRAATGHAWVRPQMCGSCKIIVIQKYTLHLHLVWHYKTCCLYQKNYRMVHHAYSLEASLSICMTHWGRAHTNTSLCNDTWVSTWLR